MCLGCLDGVWMGSESVPNNNKYVINKIILGHDIQKLAFIPVSCTAYQRRCVEVSGLCLRVSGWSLSVSGEELITNLFVKM